MKYSVRCGSKKHKFEVERSADFSKNVEVELAKKVYAVRVHEKSPAGEIKSVSINNRVLSVQIRRRPDGFPYKVILNGNAYPVEIERVESTRYKPPVPEKKIDKTVKANLPGQITRVMVEDGARVKEGQVLLVLEAMKMENEITAPAEGVVKNLSVKPGELISRGRLLLEVE